MNNLRKNLISHSYVFLEKILIQIFFPLFMLTLWGSDNFNLWIFLFAIPSFFTIFQISISLPARNEMAILYRNKKINLLNKVYQNCNFIFLFNFLTLLTLCSVYIFFNIDNPIINENINIIFITLACTLISVYFAGPMYLALTYKGSYSVFNYLVQMPEAIISSNKRTVIVGTNSIVYTDDGTSFTEAPSYQDLSQTLL